MHMCVYICREVEERQRFKFESQYWWWTILETNCLSIRSPGFSSISEDILLIFWLNTMWNSRYVFSMWHAKQKMSVFKLVHCGFRDLWSVISNIPYILRFFSDCSPACVLLETCLSFKYTASFVALLGTEWFLCFCILKPGRGTASSLCLIALYRPFSLLSLWKPLSLSSDCAILPLLIIIVFPNLSHSLSTFASFGCWDILASRSHNLSFKLPFLCHSSILSLQLTFFSTQEQQSFEPTRTYNY